jgi:hypothetical protein
MTPYPAKNRPEDQDGVDKREKSVTSQQRTNYSETGPLLNRIAATSATIAASIHSMRHDCTA